ncbi:hypothetical protein NUW58_g4954 [Xylaria curta]|uniref:Uncharacterized protein n=1 Tax=Xylaria curta TaxID=42375 RepID=A0ACC1P5N2_9PEZI|nr:hypothetical protein NUW58_g4954 [Xylaria curta]
MDPVSALGLAANIWAFVEAGFKVVNQYNDFRRNALSETRENTQLRIIVDELKLISGNLVVDRPSPLASVAEQCNKLCEQLLDLLDKLMVKDTSSAFARLRIISKSYFRSSDISSLENKLDMYRRQLMLNLLDTLSDGQSEINNKLSRLETDVQRLGCSQSGDKLADLREDLLEAVQASQGDSIQKPNKGFGPLLLQLRDFVKTTSLEVSILMKLRFDDIDDRQDIIKDPTEGTFLSQVQEVTSNDDESGAVLNELEKSLIPWLRSGSGVFHISGKAGSGKSTLIKQIWLHAQTEKCLRTWAGDKRLLCAAFFFWAAGSSEQRSLTGLYRSILVTLLSQENGLIPEVFPEFWVNGQSTAHDLAGLTRPHIIEAAFQTLLGKALSSGYRICLFIDGLDEYESADREGCWELARRIVGWADSSSRAIKLCVSSRPYDEFQTTFAPFPLMNRTQIHLHQLNRSDIERHCDKTLSVAKEFPGIPDPAKAELFIRQIDKFSEYFVHEIGRRAEGVFLWAVLVARIIISEARRGGSNEHLKEKLDEMPDAMNELYDKMLSSLKPKDKQLSNRLLFAVLTNPFNRDISALCLTWLINESAWQSRVPLGGDTYSHEKAIEDVEHLTRHLDIWTHGLIEVAKPDYGPTDGCRKLVEVLVKGGFTAHERVQLVDRDGNIRMKDRIPLSATVWMILISGLSDARQRHVSSFSKLVDAVGELLRNESQEEVLLLGSTVGKTVYDCFTTLEDFVRKHDHTAHILDELQYWPKYEGGGSESENAPTWVWERWRGRTIYRMGDSLKKLTPQDLGREGLVFDAIVSRKNILENDVACFNLW